MHQVFDNIQQHIRTQHSDENFDVFYEKCRQLTHSCFDKKIKEFLEPCQEDNVSFPNLPPNTTALWAKTQNITTLIQPNEG